MATAPATDQSRRIVTLDLIRGIAVMGIFSVNVAAFAFIFQAYMNPSAMGGHTGVDLATWFANFVVIDGKMRSLFSMLFGASMLLVIDRAVASGRSGASTHFRRMVVLALFGLAHFYFIWFGDILFLYAVTGMAAYFFLKLPTCKLIKWSVILFLLSGAMMAASSAYFRQSDVAAHSAGATQAQIREWNEIAAFGRVSDAKALEDVAIHRGPIGGRIEHMFTERLSDPFVGFFFFFPETLALMLLGMAAYRSGFFTGDWPDARYRRITLWAIPFGAIGSAALAFWTLSSNFYLPLVFFNFVVASTPFRIVMALGYAALIILAFRRPGTLRDRFAAVGRTAFTNYLGASIIAGLIFYGHGLGLYGQLSRFEAWLVAPFVWLVMLAWSKPWLDRFDYGPFEWAWRSLARWELQPMRKRPPLPFEGGDRGVGARS